MYQIGEFSKMAKTTVKTLRFYDEIGLLSPVKIDEWTGYRYYDSAQLYPLIKILEYRESGLTIDEIKSVLNGGNISTILESRKYKLEEETETIQRRIAKINNLITNIKENKLMNYKPVKIEMPECIVYYKEGIIPSFGEILDFVLSAGAEVKKNNPTLKCTEEGYCFVAYLDEGYKDKDLKIEYAEAVDSYGKESENIKFRKLEKQPAISVNHYGSYSGIRDAYAAVLKYVDEKGFEMAGPIRERYIHGCWDCEKESDYLTEIQVPIK